MSRNPTAAQVGRSIPGRTLPTQKAPGSSRLRAHRGHCVICEAEGTTPLDFICSDCGDPLGVTLYCCGCGRRLALNPDAADRFLRENGYEMDDLQGIVLKVDRCGRCMTARDRVDMRVYRLKIGP